MITHERKHQTSQSDTKKVYKAIDETDISNKVNKIVDQLLIQEGARNVVNDIVKEQLDKNPNLYDNYSLEISSPGVERPLTRKKDFKIWSNNHIKVKLFRHDNLPTRFEARLIGLSEEGINIYIDDDTEEISGEYDLKPIDVKEIILSWASDNPPTPNVIG